MAVTDDAIASIKQMILSGQLRAGDRLPKEQDLAEHLGLSRSSLREAVKALSLLGVLDVRQGDGTYVTQLDASLLVNALSFVVDFHSDETAIQFVEVRRLLEPAATATAARRMGAEQIQELEDILNAPGEDPSIDDLVRSDLAFHNKIAAAAGNPALTALLASLAAPTQRARTWHGIHREGAAERTMFEHRSILNAIRIGDPIAAEAWATVHIVGVQSWLTGALAAGGSSGSLSPDAPSSSGLGRRP